MTIRLRERRALLDRLQRETSRETRRQMQQDVTRLVSDLERLTPRDTGFAAESWESTSVRPTLFGGEQTAEISNPAEYIQELNEGSSTQAPARFIESAAGRYFTQIRPLRGRRQ